MSSQQSRRQISSRFLYVNALSLDGVHLSVWCLLDVPHIVRLSRLCQGRPRPCSRPLPAAVFVLVKIPNVSTRTHV